MAGIIIFIPEPSLPYQQEIYSLHRLASLKMNSNHTLDLEQYIMVYVTFYHGHN